MDVKNLGRDSVVQRAAAVFAAAGITNIQRVITDNARDYRSCTVFAEAVTGIGARQKVIGPHCPWINGKVARFNRALAIEWATCVPTSPTTTAPWR